MRRDHGIRFDCASREAPNSLESGYLAIELRGIPSRALEFLVERDPFRMTLSRVAISIALASGLLPLVAHSAGPDYLSDDREPADQVSDLATPFTELKKAKPERRLFRSTEEPFLRDLEFGLRPRFYFRSLRNATGLNNTFAGGGSVGFTTGWWRETLQFGVAGFTSQPLAKNADGRDRTGLVAPDGDGFSVLGLAWVKLKVGPATATLYRQELNLPFIHANDSRMIPNTFEAYQVEMEPLQGLRFSLGYVARIKLRNGDTFIPMSEAAGAPDIDRGAGFAGFLLGAEDKTYLGAIVESTFDLYNCTYVQTGHTWRWDVGFEVRTDLQFQNLWVRVRYATNESNVRSSINDFRVIVNYSATF